MGPDPSTTPTTPARWAAIAEAFEAAGAQVHTQVVAPEDFQSTITALWDVADRPEAVVVAGGDGTVGCAAAVAAGTDLVLGVLPLGTFNHFAKDLGMPTELEAAAAALVDGVVREVDVAEVNGRVFVNNSALGMYPTMVAIRDRIRDKRGWGKVRAVPVAAWRAWRSFPLHRLDLTGDGIHRRRVRSPLVFIGNGVYDNASGGVHERVELTEGRLGVSVARVISRWGLVRMLVRTWASGSSKARELDVSEVSELTVDSRTESIRVSLDGEIDWLELPLHYRTRPGALHVLAPAGESPGAEPVDRPVTPDEAVKG